MRVDRPEGSKGQSEKGGKGGWWTYVPGTTEDGRPGGKKNATGKGTGEYRKGSTPSDIASRSGSQERELKYERERETQCQTRQQSYPGGSSMIHDHRQQQRMEYPSHHDQPLQESTNLSLAQMAGDHSGHEIFPYDGSAGDISEIARLAGGGHPEGGLEQELQPFDAAYEYSNGGQENFSFPNSDYYQ